MRAFMAILKREFFSYFFSPLAYVVLTCFLVFNGITFRGILEALNSPDAPRNALMALFFNNVFFWFFMMLVSCLISMRLLSEERKSGSIESLLTAPVGEGTVVVAKFMAAWAFFLSLWVPTLLYPILLSRYGSVELGPVAGGYLGIALIGALFVAAGTFGSSLTKNQIAAAIIGFVFIISIVFVGVFESFATDPKMRETLAYLNLLGHMDDFSRGIIDTRRLIYTISTAVFFLFLSTKALEANKGR
ncbi:MAG: ABC transporter permease [Thermoanaerobaculia bacterium]